MPPEEALVGGAGVRQRYHGDGDGVAVTSCVIRCFSRQPLPRWREA